MAVLAGNQARPVQQHTPGCAGSRTRTRARAITHLPPSQREMCTRQRRLEHSQSLLRCRNAAPFAGPFPSCAGALWSSGAPRGVGATPSLVLPGSEARSIACFCTRESVPTHDWDAGALPWRFIHCGAMAKRARAGAELSIPVRSPRGCWGRSRNLPQTRHRRHHHRSCIPARL